MRSLFAALAPLAFGAASLAAPASALAAPSAVLSGTHVLEGDRFYNELTLQAGARLVLAPKPGGAKARIVAHKITIFAGAVIDASGAVT